MELLILLSAVALPNWNHHQNQLYTVFKTHEVWTLVLNRRTTIRPANRSCSHKSVVVLSCLHNERRRWKVAPLQASVAALTSHQRRTKHEVALSSLIWYPRSNGLQCIISHQVDLPLHKLFIYANLLSIIFTYNKIYL